MTYGVVFNDRDPKHMDPAIMERETALASFVFLVGGLTY